MRLRGTLLQLLTAAVALPGCPPTGNCPDNETGTIELTEPLQPALQAMVDRCRTAGGYDSIECEPMCRELIVRELGGPPDDVYSCYLSEDTNTATAVTARVSWTVGPMCVGGRRPAGYAASLVDGRSVGGFLAEQARLEAASVRAFLELAHALAFHGAPSALVQACRAAAGDEIVHAVLIGRLARAFGVTPIIDDAPPASLPALEALARANAVEGCIRETWGAAVATWQAHASSHPAIRAAMRQIAPDETKHANLSDAIHQWAMQQLDSDARERVGIARAIALAELANSLECAVPECLVDIAGLPPKHIATLLLSAMSRDGEPCANVHRRNDRCRGQVGSEIRKLT